MMEAVPLLPAQLAQWLVASLLLALRIAPLLGFAPPFNLVRLPARYRLFLGLGLAASVAASNLAVGEPVDLLLGSLIVAAACELALGLLVAILFQMGFAALYLAGRTLDIQAGLGLAVLIDPTTRAQTPLVGTLFAYAAGALFFVADGHLELLRIMGASLQAVPVGSWSIPGSLDRLEAFIATAFFLAFGVAGAAMGALFAIDLAVAMLSRTVPQMNALVLGFQVKTIALLLILPMSFGLGGALLLRMARLSVEALPGLLG